MNGSHGPEAQALAGGRLMAAAGAAAGAGARDVTDAARPGVGAWVFGVILPAFVVAFEAVSGFCAALSFDPIPTLWHLLLLALVPAANAWTCLALRRQQVRHARVLAWMNGAAAGVCLGYAVILLPLVPLAVLALAVLGAGLIVLSPAIAFFVTVSLGRRLDRMAASQEPGVGVPDRWKGLAASLTALLVLAAPTIVTFVGVKQVIREPHDGAAVRFLRAYGSREQLLRWCYATERPLAPLRLIRAVLERPLNLDGLLPGLTPLAAEPARQVFYRVTGMPYNAVEPPPVRGLRGSSIGPLFDTSEMDFEQGGSAVAGRIRGLDLEQSAIQGAVEGDAGMSYVEWTLTFRNDSSVQREARAQVALPPGGVVSRLTLWIDGQEQEAAYGERGQVRSAYERVVRQRRDPVLVTTSGKDRVLIQCFPVPPKGGIMKAKVGITAPVTLRSHGEGVVRLPFLVERNFGLPKDSRHAVFLKSDAALAVQSGPAGAGVHTAAVADGWTLQGSLSRADIEAPFAVWVSRASGTIRAWTEDPAGGAGLIVVQTVAERQADPVEHLIVVIDGSRGMAAHREALARCVEGLPERLQFAVILAGDEAVELCPMQPATAKNRERAARLIRAAVFAGGCDNVPALREAMTAGRSLPDDAVVWLHAAQPVGLSDAERLVTDWSLAPGAPAVHEVPLEPGPDVVAGVLRDAPFVRPVAMFGDAGEDLRHAFGLVTGTVAGLEFERRRVTRGAATQEEEGNHGLHGWHGFEEQEDLRGERGSTGIVVHASSHLARLWASGEVQRLIATGAAGDRADAVRLAGAYRLVTPVSAAVVLETKEQYQQAGLEPVDPDSVPSIAAVPEPETWALLAIGAAAMLLVRMRKGQRMRAGGRIRG